MTRINERVRQWSQYFVEWRVSLIDLQVASFYPFQATFEDSFVVAFVKLYHPSEYIVIHVCRWDFVVDINLRAYY